MKPTVLAVSLVAVAVGSSILAAPAAQLRPGEPTQARVWVENRGPGEALPVQVLGLDEAAKPLRMEIVGNPGVAIVGAPTIQTRAARQPWDYRTISVAAGQDASAALNQAGTDGWEAVNFQLGPQQATVVLLKRPR